MGAIGRFKITSIRSLISLASLSRESLQPQTYHNISSSHNNNERNLSQTFRRTLVTPLNILSQSPQFPSFQSIPPQYLYNPIEFNEFQAQNMKNDELGTLEFVKLVHKTKDFPSRKDGIDFITNSDIKTDANQVYFAIWAMRNEWELAMLAFELSVKWNFINDNILGLIVWVLGSHHKFDIAWSLISDAHRLVDTRRAMLSMIERYAAANFPEKAIKTFHFMDKLSASPDHEAFYSLITALCKYGNVEEAEEFMLINKKLFPPETEGFNIILHGWCTISIDILEAKRVWREMASYCVTPDATSYTHMIHCYSKVGNLFDSLRVYDEMKRRGWVPGLEVYNSLIYVMANDNCFSEALKILDRIKVMGLRPDSRSYDCLICPLCEVGKFEEARVLLQTMTQEGVRPTIETYKAFLKEGNLENTFEILQKMKYDNVGPDSGTFLLTFDRFFKLRQPESVLKVWVEMQHYGVNPNSKHYLCLIHGLSNCGCLMKAKEMHTEMISNGFVDDPKLKNLLQGSHRGKVRATIVKHVGRSDSRSSYSMLHKGRKKQVGSNSLRNKKPI